MKQRVSTLDLSFRRGRRANLAGAGVTLLVGLGAVAYARTLPFLSPIGPGPGFLPTWVAAGLAASAAVWFLRAAFRPYHGVNITEFPSKAGLMRVALVIGATGLFAGTMEFLGFRAGMALYVAALLVSVTRARLLVALGAAVLISLAIGQSLALIGIHVPRSDLPFIAPLGL